MASLGEYGRRSFKGTPSTYKWTTSLFLWALFLESVWLCVLICVLLNYEFFFVKIECGLYFLDRFDVLMLKVIFKK